MTKILITGGLGFLGQHVTKILLGANADSEILILARSSSKFFLTELNSQRVKVISNIDITDKKSIESHFENVDYVIHIAALISFWQKDQLRLREINILGTRNVVELCLQHGIKRMVHVSSTATIGGSQTMQKPADETHDYDWKGKSNYDYGLSKYFAEKEVERGVALGLDVVIANPCTVLGYGDKKFLPVVDTALKNIPFCLSGGSHMIDVRDLARGIALLLTKGGAGERYLLVGEFRTQKEIMTELSVILKTKLPVFVVSSKVLILALPFLALTDFLSSERPKLTSTIVRNGLSPSYYTGLKAQKDLNWKPEFTLAESLRQVVSFHNEVKQ